MYVCYLAKTEKFEQREFNKPCIQQSLFGERVTNHEQKPHTIIKKSDTVVNHLQTYEVSITVNIKNSGYLYIPHNENEPFFFECYYSKKNFKVHLCQNNNILYINNSKQLTLEFEKVTKDTFNLEIVSINMSALISQFNNISGIWFSKINDTNVNAASIHGNKVDESSLYNQLKHNKISSININYPFNGKTFNIMITKKGAVVILTPCDDSTKLNLITELTNLYLKPNFETT